MFDDNYLNWSTLAWWSITWGHRSNGHPVFPASENDHGVVLATLPILSHNSSEYTLACLFLRDNISVLLPPLESLRLDTNACSARRSHANKVLQQWPCLRPRSAQQEDQKLGTAPEWVITAQIFSLKSFNWSQVSVSDLEPFDSPLGHLLNLPSVLSGLFLDLQPLIKSVPHSHTPRNNGREVRHEQCSYANSGTSQRQPLLPSSYGGGDPGLRIAVYHMNGLDNEALFGCFIDKRFPNMHDCGRARHRWQHVRSLCRSPHLYRHSLAGHLTTTQLQYIEALATASTTNDEAETWRDCFVYLYPDFEEIRNQLNPYVGQSLWNREAISRSHQARLQQQPNEIPNFANNTTRLLFLDPLIGPSDFGAPVAAAPMGRIPPLGRQYPNSGSRSTHSTGSSFSYESHTRYSTRRSAGQPTAQGRRSSARRGSHSTSSQRSTHSGRPAPVRANLPIDPQLETMQPSPRTTAGPYSNSLWGERRSSVPTVTTATTLTMETDQRSLEEGYLLAPILTPPDFPRTSPNDIVPRILDDVPYGPTSLRAFARDADQVQEQDQLQGYMNGNRECEGGQVMYINPHDIHLQPPDGTQWRRPGRG